jgi:hypothetical protein
MHEARGRTTGIVPPTGPGPGGAGEPDLDARPEPVRRVLRALRAAGCEEAFVLAGAGPGGSAVVMARRDGVELRGTARVGLDGVVTLRLSGTHRAFP